MHAAVLTSPNSHMFSRKNTKTQVEPLTALEVSVVHENDGCIFNDCIITSVIFVVIVIILCDADGMALVKQPTRWKQQPTCDTSAEFNLKLDKQYQCCRGVATKWLPHQPAVMFTIACTVSRLGCGRV